MLQVAQMVPVVGLSLLASEQRLSRRGQPLCRRDVVIASVSQVVFCQLITCLDKIGFKSRNSLLYYSIRQ